jgi:hypothetical protein
MKVISDIVEKDGREIPRYRVEGGGNSLEKAECQPSAWKEGILSCIPLFSSICHPHILCRVIFPLPSAPITFLPF